MTFKKLALLGAVAVTAGACQTTGSMDYTDAHAVIRAGHPDVTVSPEPTNSFTRDDGSSCLEFTTFRPGSGGSARQGAAVVCRYEGQRWILVSRGPQMEEGGGSNWRPITGN